MNNGDRLTYLNKYSFTWNQVANYLCESKMVTRESVIGAISYLTLSWVMSHPEQAQQWYNLMIHDDNYIKVPEIVVDTISQYLIAFADSVEVNA